MTVLLRGTFGSMADTIQAAIRGAIADAPCDVFPVEAINVRLAGLNRSVRFADEEVDTILDMECGDRRTFLLLSLLYPNFDYSNPFHVDHIFPRAKMTELRLKTRGLAVDVARDATTLRDNLANLQLLAGGPNKAKSDSDFDVWLTTQFPSATDRGYFLAMHRFPQMVAFTYETFLDFIAARRAILFAVLKAELNPETASAAAA